jgi:hypothetical protein
MCGRACVCWHTRWGLLTPGCQLQAYTVYKILYQRPQYTLRYTTFMEIMAPIFRMDVFNGLIGPTLHNVHTGVLGGNVLCLLCMDCPGVAIAAAGNGSQGWDCHASTECCKCKCHVLRKADSVLLQLPTQE